MKKIINFFKTTYEIRTEKRENDLWYYVWRRKLGIWRKYCYGTLNLINAEEQLNKFKSGQLKFPDSNFVYILKKFPKTIKATILCIRFPFLYPRNRFTGTHYTNWKFYDYAHNVYREGIDFLGREHHFKMIIVNKRKYYWGKFLKWIHNYPMQIFYCIPTHTELDLMDTGWRKAFGIQMCKEIRKQLIKDKMLYKWRITDIKEKYGTLRIYCNRSSNELYNILNKYESLSEHTCITCGNEAKWESMGWISPYCDDCKNSMKHAKFVKICNQNIK